MGASGWDYIQPFDVDLQTTLEALRRRVFDDGDYFWFDSIPRMATLTELDMALNAEPDFESLEFDPLIDVYTSGTHSILDVRTVGPHGDLEQLDEAGAVELFGTATPSGEDFERLELNRVLSSRWSKGFCVTLHDPQGDVTAVGFWGMSGD